MAVIYSRKRIRLPKPYRKKHSFNLKINNKKIKFLTIIIIAILTFVIIIKASTPIFETICKDKAKSIATIICNEETTKVMKNYQYEDIVTIYKDTNENITMIKTNITSINFIISEVAEKIQKSIEETTSEQIELKLGEFLGNKLLSGIGPVIPVKLSTVGNVQTDLRSEFRAEGINQTMHRIYLQIECEVSILTPYKNIQEKISNQVLIAENIIVGKIPDTYYNIEGLSNDNTLDILE